MGKITKYLYQFGHDVRVVTNKHRSEDRSAPLEIPKEYCTYTNTTTFEQIIGKDYYEKTMFGKAIFRAKIAIKKRKSSYLLPDSSWAWYTNGVKEANELLKNWKPDLIYSSALPISAHFVARKISINHDIPWVAEYRDLWSGGHGARVSNIQSAFLKRIETWLLKPTIGLVTVSKPLAAYLRHLHKKSVSVIYNGFDSNPYAQSSYPEKRSESDKLTIVYTGSIYEGRDPTVLFEAIDRLAELKEYIQVKFYTSSNSMIEEKIKNYNLENSVKRLDFVPYNQSLRIQSEADVLLYLSYSSDTHAGRGILSGKVFEYLGAERPILSIGADSNHLLIEQGLMLHLNDPEKIKNQLVQWINEKKENGIKEVNTDLPIRNTYSRLEQTKRLEEFIFSLLY